MRRWETVVQLAKSRIPEGDIGMTEPVLFAITVVEMHDRIRELEAALGEREVCCTSYRGTVKAQLFLADTGDGRPQPRLHIECPTMGTTHFDGKSFAECVAMLADAYEEAENRVAAAIRARGAP